MVTNEDGGCFDLFSDDDSDWDANPDYEDWGSEGDLDANSIDNEIVDGETTRLILPDSAAGPSVPSGTARIGSSDKRKQLNKSEKKRLVDAIYAIANVACCPLGPPELLRFNTHLLHA